MGSLGVYYNGKLVKRLSLAAARTSTRSVVVLPRLTRPGTIALKVLTTGKPVQVDGLVAARA